MKRILKFSTNLLNISLKRNTLVLRNTLNLRQFSSINKDDSPSIPEIIIEKNDTNKNEIGDVEGLSGNDYTQKAKENKDKADKTPLIHYHTVIVPFSKIVIKKPSDNDALVNLMIKYGKLTPIDEEKTIIDDITLTYQKGDPLPKLMKKDTSYLIGVPCKVSYYHKEKVVIEGLDKVYKISSHTKSSGAKFFNPKESTAMGVNYNRDSDYLQECQSLCQNILDSLRYIHKALKLDDEFFGDDKISFNFKFKDIKERIDDTNSEDLSNFDEYIKFSYYFILKSYAISNLMTSNSTQMYSSANDLVKQLIDIEDLKLKFQNIKDILENLGNFIKLKYEVYEFPHNLQFQREDPFRHETEEEMKRITMYKESIDNKISEVDATEKQKEEYKRKINEIKTMSEEVKKHIEKEISKVSSVYLDQENNKRVEYINHILNLPWDKYDEPKWDIEHAKKVLDGSLYGLQETKERIYEFIAKNLRKNNKKGCVILLTGGPGTGKTRIAKLIGEALQRKVGFVSLAGLNDSKSILGFKRTYVGSTPGMFIREMQHVGVSNPVIVVDEIDKVGFRGHHSSVYHALLQLLNTEENHRFSDHYLEIPFDFSNVVFILTSNNEKIFPPLIDRMEVIRVEPYVFYEKFLILKNYALDQIIKEYNFQEFENRFQITDKALYKLVFDYCKRESGIRKAKRLLEAVIRKVNSKLELEANNSEEPMQINTNNILKILNEPKDEDPVLTDMIMNSSKRPGCCVGLFVSKTDQSNSWGSASVFSMSIKEIRKLNHFRDKTVNKISETHLEDVEEDVKVSNPLVKNDVEKEDDKKSKKNVFKISSSGNLGEDSLQSVDIALNVATNFLKKIAPDKANFFYEHQLHHDCPEILLPKSGPSAGIVIFLCSMSLALNKPIIPNLAMTGEICIDGSVLKIGGVKEKSQGAQQFGVKTLVVPIGNKYDFIELPQNLKDSFERVYFVENVQQVYNIGFNLNTSGIDCYIPEKYLGDVRDVLTEETFIENNLVDRLFK